MATGQRTVVRRKLTTNINTLTTTFADETKCEHAIIDNVFEQLDISIADLSRLNSQIHAEAANFDETQFDQDYKAEQKSRQDIVNLKVKYIELCNKFPRVTAASAVAQSPSTPQNIQHPFISDLPLKKLEDIQIFDGNPLEYQNSGIRSTMAWINPP